MLLVLVYLVLILGLVFWLQSPSLMATNSLKINKRPAEILEEYLKNFSFGNRGDLGQKVSLPKYKFYTEVVELLLSLARRMGGNYQDSLMFLREGLKGDRQFEKKLRESLMGIWAQMLLMMLLTWTFIFTALSLTDIKVPAGKLFLILLWQSIGLSMLPFLLKYFRHKFFADIGKLWKMLYVLNSLSRVPLSRSEIFTMAGIQDLKHIKQKNLSHLVDKLIDTCQKAMKNGGSYSEEVLGLMEELRFQEKWHFELFEKRLTLIKLGLLALFFLPSYLVFIFLILGSLMSQMA